MHCAAVSYSFLASHFCLCTAHAATRIRAYGCGPIQRQAEPNDYRGVLLLLGAGAGSVEFERLNSHMEVRVCAIVGFSQCSCSVTNDGSSVSSAKLNVLRSLTDRYKAVPIRSLYGGRFRRCSNILVVEPPKSTSVVFDVSGAGLQGDIFFFHLQASSAGPMREPAAFRPHADLSQVVTAVGNITSPDVVQTTANGSRR
ncbi:uncharacterized protein B0H18DRAFT_1049437 [Fomitopsis serialis]|uniref:uncharacterized protein n=1 Tax=Fomitopsis serialis TaxID=139415 RepID=UPI002007EDFA|nr:uncharacterized protein B0H18DRAFT_1049437 [Neoantrodia serialis]KAH9913304.1 hypothetical protein B0H18DRAFT_1049437 [Neoantrodia serialis]